MGDATGIPSEEAFGLDRIWDIVFVATGIPGASALGLPLLFQSGSSLSGLEDAIRAWVKASSGFGDERVIFADQKVERPAGPYFTIRIGDSTQLGTTDALQDSFDAARVGREIETRVLGERTVTVSIQVFNAGTTGSKSAVSLLSAVRLALSLPSIGDIFDSYGVTSPYDPGPVKNLGTLLGTAFDGRASMDVRFFIRETASDFVTWIMRAEGTINAIPYAIEEP